MMAEDREEYLEKQIQDLDEQMKSLGAKLEEELGVSCDFGSCVFDPEIETTEHKIEEIQRRKKMLEAMVKSLKECETK
jgi:hypothetical protein